MSEHSFHGHTAALLDPVWCLTCRDVHIATLPQVTFACADCGFGCWGDTVASAHATNLPDHIVYPRHHATTCILPEAPVARAGNQAHAAAHTHTTNNEEQP